MLQAFHISEAIIKTRAAVMKAFATYDPPYSYLAAGSALAFGMAQVQPIRSQKFTARRQGGAVSENKPYMVGEGGPETFIPNSSGYISPGVGGKNVNVNFTINAVDTAGFQQLLANERGMIVGMINSAVNQQGKSDII
jgi:SLT domain-containing protein